MQTTALKMPVSLDPYRSNKFRSPIVVLSKEPNQGSKLPWISLPVLFFRLAANYPTN
jgi:hypothetical protein